MRVNPNIITISVLAGAGGEDAKDWARMLLRMYQKYAAIKNWKISFINDNTLEIKGENIYEKLKNESGVHRLVRISPFDAKKLRHTSFALVEVLPNIEAKELQIPEKDLKVEFTRSSGPGGQNVNKVETAVRIVHLPTGFSASSRSERSQVQNREKALALLKAKIFQELQNKKTKELGDLKTKVAVEWGSQIRSYVLHPYKLVKDHRTKTESHDPDRVLMGELDKFIESELLLE